MRAQWLCCLLLSLSLTVFCLAEEVEKEEQKGTEYAKGAVCGYCKYCKFCSLCESDCPCTDTSRAGCDMCKYCKYCTLCKACDTFCKAGGILDSMMSSLMGDMTGLDSKEVNKDLDSIKEYL